MSNVPVEIFLPLIGLSLSMGVLGAWKNIPFALLVAGAIVMFLAVDTDTIRIGIFPNNSTVTGSVTTYTFQEDNFEFTQWHKIFVGLIGSVILFIGGMEWRNSKSN